MKTLLKEIIIYLLILLILAPLQHGDLLSHPLERFNLMLEHQSYLHPFIWTSIVYVGIGIFRLFLKYILKLVRK